MEALRYPVYSDAMLRAQLGMAYAAVDKTSFPNKESLALAEFEKAVDTLPECVELSEKVEQEAVVAENGEAYIRSEYGRILYQFGYIDKAIEQYKCSLSRDSGIAVVTRRNLGQLYEMVGETQKAIEMYQSLMGLCEQISRGQIELLQFAHDRLRDLGIESVECPLLPVG